MTGLRAAPGRRDDPLGRRVVDSQQRLMRRRFHDGNVPMPSSTDWSSRDDRRPVSPGPRGRSRLDDRRHLGDPRRSPDPAAARPPPPTPTRRPASRRPGAARVDPRRLPALRRPGVRRDGRHRRGRGLERRAPPRATAPAAANAVPAGSTVSQGPTDVTAVAAAATPSVVTITSETAARNGFSPFQVPATGVGSGVVLTADGYILTNNHVIAGQLVADRDARGRHAVPGDGRQGRPGP